MVNDKSHVIEYVKTIKPRSAAHKILSQDDYLDGKVAKVDFSDSGQETAIWCVLTKRHRGYAESESQLIQQLQIASVAGSRRFDWINQIFNISGLIAFVLVGASVYLTVTRQDGNIPEHLKAAVLTIIGFYFGGLVRTKQTHQSSDK